MERFNIDISNLEDAQKKALTKQMLKIVLARMNPEQQKLFLLKMNKVAYQAELQKKYMKRKRLVKTLTLPILPMLYMVAILKTLILKKMYLKQAMIVMQSLKRLRDLKSSKTMNLISPERKEEKKVKTQDYTS
jgi:hypothetical protein